MATGNTTRRAATAASARSVLILCPRAAADSLSGHPRKATGSAEAALPLLCVFLSSSYQLLRLHVHDLRLISRRTRRDVCCLSCSSRARSRAPDHYATPVY